jgi:hypothetical protein
LLVSAFKSISQIAKGISLGDDLNGDKSKTKNPLDMLFSATKLAFKTCLDPIQKQANWNLKDALAGSTVPATVLTALGKAVTLKFDATAGLTDTCISLALADFKNMAMSASATIGFTANAQAEAVLPRTSFAESAALYSVPLPEANACGSIDLPGPLGSVGWKTEVSIAMKWEADGSLEGIKASIDFDIDWQATLGMKLEKGKVTPTISIPKLWKDDLVPKITIPNIVEGRGQARVEVQLTLKLHMFKCEKGYGTTDTCDVGFGFSTPTTTIGGTVTLGMACNADVGKLSFNCKTYTGGIDHIMKQIKEARSLITGGARRSRRASTAMAVIGGDHSAVDIGADIRLPICFGNKGTVPLGTSTIDIKNEIAKYDFLPTGVVDSAVKQFDVSVKSDIENACAVFSIGNELTPLLEAGLVAKGEVDFNFEFTLKVDEFGNIGKRLCIPLDGISAQNTIELPLGLPAIDWAFLTKLELWITADTQLVGDITIVAQLKAKSSVSVDLRLDANGVTPKVGYPVTSYEGSTFKLTQGGVELKEIPVTFHASLTTMFAVMESGTALPAMECKEDAVESTDDNQKDADQGMGTQKPRLACLQKPLAR